MMVDLEKLELGVVINVIKEPFIMNIINLTNEYVF